MEPTGNGHALTSARSLSFPSSFLYQQLQQVLQTKFNGASPALLPPMSHRHPGSATLRYEIPPEQWPVVLRRIVENQEPLRKVAGDYGVSYETVRRTVRAAHRQGAS